MWQFEHHVDHARNLIAHHVEGYFAGSIGRDFGFEDNPEMVILVDDYGVGLRCSFKTLPARTRIDHVADNVLRSEIFRKLYIRVIGRRWHRRLEEQT